MKDQYEELRGARLLNCFCLHPAIEWSHSALFSNIHSSAYCVQFTHPQDVHPYPVQEVGEDEDVGGRVRCLAEVEDHIYTLEDKESFYYGLISTRE